MPPTADLLILYTCRYGVRFEYSEFAVSGRSATIWEGTKTRQNIAIGFVRHVQAPSTHAQLKAASAPLEHVIGAVLGGHLPRGWTSIPAW